MSLSLQTHNPGQQRGVGLIEVLITLLVLSLGFTASARFQVLSMRENQNSLYQSHAGTLIESMVDRMRNNPEGVDAGAYDSINTKTAGPPGKCIQTTCTPKQQAIEDIARWRHSISPLDGSQPKLPFSSTGEPAHGFISMPDNGVYTIELIWEALVQGETEMQSLSMSFRP